MKKIIFKVLPILLIFAGLILILYPLYPKFVFWYKIKTNVTAGYEYKSELALNNKIQDIDLTQLKPIPKDNRLVIPAIQVDAKIIESETKQALDKGMWRRPNSSTPAQKGNTVLSGHRFMYTSGPNTLYNLDKLKIDDEIIIFWQGKEYDYKVYEIKTVTPDQVEIEENTQEKILTIYTCTPLWTAKKRLVVIAKPI